MIKEEMGFCRWTISYKKQQVFNPAKLLECIKRGNNLTGWNYHLVGILFRVFCYTS